MAGDGNVKGHGGASGVFSGGLSGVAFGADINMVSRVTQGCLPLARAHQITAAEHNLVLGLDGEPALEVLMRELGVTPDEQRGALDSVRATLAGLTERSDVTGAALDAPTITRAGNFGSDVLVRHINLFSSVETSKMAKQSSMIRV